LAAGTVDVDMVLKSVENRLERIFEKTFSRTFKSTLQPIEIGTRKSTDSKKRW
jgi:hypothetical protein